MSGPTEARAGLAPLGALALVALGGGVGAGLREALVLGFAEHPLRVTLAINLVGAFALGLLLEWLAGAGDTRRTRELRLALGTGLCGGFTTYSAVALQGATLLTGGDAVMATGYAVATLCLGALATLAGMGLAGGLTGSGPTGPRRAPGLPRTPGLPSTSGPRVRPSRRDDE